MRSCSRRESHSEVRVNALAPLEGRSPPLCASRIHYTPTPVMARRGVLAPSLLSLSLFATACDDTPTTSLDATVDAARDAALDAPTRTATLRLDDTGARVIVNAGPRGVSLRVERPDGST